MPLPTTLERSVGYGEESTYGTAVAVDRFLPVVSTDPLDEDVEQIESEAVIAGRQTRDSQLQAPGNKSYSGSIEHEFLFSGVGLLLKHMLGADGTTGAGPYTHVFTPGDRTGLSLTTQYRIPDVGGTVRALTYAGCKIDGWELGIAQGENVTLGLDMVARELLLEESIDEPSFGTDLQPVPFLVVSIELDAAAVKVTSLNLSGESGHGNDRRFVGSALIDEPLQGEYQTVSGSMEVELHDLAHYDDVRDGTDHALKVEAERGDDKLTVECNVRITDGQTPTESDGRYMQSLEFVALGDASGGGDEDAVKITLVNGDETP